MRLGQLARKLALRPGDITEFLTAQNLPNEGSNTRLDDEQVAQILRKFAPSVSLESILQSTPPSNEDVGATPVAAMTNLYQPSPEQSIEPDFPSAEETNLIEEAVPKVSLDLEISDEKTEVIKAPKVELPGLKVIGKIELKETIKKEEKTVSENPPTENETPPEEKSRPRVERRQNDYSKNRIERSGKNPLAAKREREAREAEKRRQAENNREKEKRTKNYLKKVKPAVPTKRARTIEEHVMEMTEEESTPPPKTLWGKFLKWFWRQ